MRLLHEAGWTQEELNSYYNIIIANIFDGMKEVCTHMAKLELEYADKENTKRARYYRELSATDRPPLSASEAERIKKLWEDKNFAKCLQDMVGTSDLIIHNLTYFVNRLEDIVSEGYAPNDEDILYCRQRSAGATDTIFVKDKVRYTLIDMGGQKPERTKWDLVLGSGVRGIFFFVAVDEYNTPCQEEKGKTKFEVSLETWADLLNNPKLLNLNIVLLLNKIDLIDAKLKLDFSTFTKQFPKFKGEKTRDAALKYIEEQFFKVIPQDFPSENIACYHCCALDSELVERLLEQCTQWRIEASY